MYISKLDISHFVLYKRGHTDFEEEYEERFFNEKIKKSKYKDTNYSIMKCLWYTGNPWIIFYQYDENTIIEIDGYRTRKECIYFLEQSNAIKKLPELCDKYFEFLKFKEDLNKELNE